MNGLRFTTTFTIESKFFTMGLTKNQVATAFSEFTQAQANYFNNNNTMGDTLWKNSYGSGYDDSVDDLIGVTDAMSESDIFWLQDQTGFAFRGKRSARPC